VSSKLDQVPNLVLVGEKEMFSRLIVSLLVLLVAVSWSVWRAEATELTFELPDRDKQCFYEQIDKGTRCTLEYQVPIFTVTALHSM